MYRACPKKWELSYIKKLAPKESSIHLVFGNAMHTVIQEWVTIIYNDTIKKGEEYDFDIRLKECLAQEYKLAKEKQDSHFSTADQLKEFYEDGIATLQWLRKKRKGYFSSKGWELAGIEIPLSMTPYKERPKVKLTAFLDIVLYDKINRSYHIIDLKTSTRGWSADDKKDKAKTDQVLLYKKYFSTLYNVDEDKITVEFLILRRKVVEDSMYPMKRVQSIVPAQKGISVNKCAKLFEDWIKEVFTDTGDYNVTRQYPALMGKNKWNCRFCPFSTSYDLCPTSCRK